MSDQPKYRKGQTLVNKNNDRQITIINPVTRRLIVKGYSGFSDEFTGEYLVSVLAESGKQEHISEDILDRFFETPS